PGPRVIPDRPLAKLGHLAAGQPGVPGSARGQIGADRPGHPTRLDDRVLSTEQSPGERSPQGRVELGDLIRIEQPIAPVTGIGPGGGLLEYCQLGVASGERQRAVRPEPGARDPAGGLLPELPGSQRELELGTAGATADPDEPEVANARAPRPR